MGKSRFHGLYLQNTGHRCIFPLSPIPANAKEWSPVEIWVKMRSTSIRLFDFLLFASKGSSGGPMLIFSQSDMMMSRLLLQETRVSIQHEYLIEIKQDSWNESMDSALSRLRAVMSDESWKGSPTHHFE